MKFSDMPVIMLTAKGSDMDKILGLEYGADDYISKPFNILEVKARIRAIIRRSMKAKRQKKEEQANTYIGSGDLKMDTEGRVVAFANGAGGKIIFGIADKTREVVGFDKEEVFKKMDAIANAVSDSCEPAIIPDITLQTVDGKTVIVVEVSEGRQRPYYIKAPWQRWRCICSCCRNYPPCRRVYDKRIVV